MAFIDLSSEIMVGKIVTADLSSEITAGLEYVYNKKELFIDFGPNGNFELSPISAGHFKKVLIGFDVFTEQITIVEGIEAEKYSATLIPSYTTMFKPFAIITVAENGGSISDIAQSDIISVRNCLNI